MSSSARDEELGRSREACPVCGVQRLAVEKPVQIAVLGVQPNSDLFGMGDPEVRTPPAIVCLACGTRWSDIEAFRTGRPDPILVGPPAPEESETGPGAEPDAPPRRRRPGSAAGS